MAGPDFFQSISISSHFHFFYASFFFLIQFFLSNCPDLLLRIFLPFFFFDCLTQHHCRKCGGVVCGNCSTKKFLLPAQSSKPLRVCDNCYNVLSSGKTQSDQESKKKSKLNVVCFNRFLCSGNWKGKQWMLNCRGNFYQPINEESFIWWSCIISPDQAMFQPKQKLWITGIQLCMMYI